MIVLQFVLQNYKMHETSIDGIIQAISVDHIELEGILFYK